MSKTARNIFAILGIVLLVVIVVGVGAFLLLSRSLAVGYRMMGPGVGIMRGFGFPWGGGLVAILFFLLLVGGIFWLAALPGRRVEPPQSTSTLPAPEAPLDILKRRYAQGEITKEQFDQIKQDLGV
jgi:putative membrane protein